MNVRPGRLRSSNGRTAFAGDGSTGWIASGRDRVRGLLSVTATAASVPALAIYAPFRAIPIKAIRERAELASLDAQLVSAFGDLPVLLDDPVQAAIVRERLAEAIRWVRDRELRRGRADRPLRRRDRQLFDAARRGLPRPRGEQAHHAWPGTRPWLAPGTDDRSVRGGQPDPGRSRRGASGPPLGRLLGVVRSGAGRRAQGGRQLPAFAVEAVLDRRPRRRSRSRAARSRTSCTWARITTATGGTTRGSWSR